MQFVPYRELRNEPSALRKKLVREGELIVTVDNKPFAVMINLGDENVEDILLMVSRLRAQMAAREMPSLSERTAPEMLSAPAERKAVRICASTVMTGNRGQCRRRARSE